MRAFTAARTEPSHRVRLLAFLAWALAFTGSAAMAQIGGGHTLFGDLKIDERQMDKLAPKTYYVILYRVGSQQGIRQPVPNNGRYRFLTVSNGHYELALETDGQEVVRIPILLTEQYSTDIRRDLHFEWKADNPPSREQRASEVAVADLYDRPDENRKRFRSAMGKGGRGDHLSARLLMEQIVESDPGDFEAWTELGTLHFKLGNLEGAESAYLRALEIHRDFSLALMNLSKLYMEKGRYEEALEILEGRSSAEALLLAGEIHLRLKKGSKAEQLFLEALRLDPVGMADAHLRLAALYRAAGMKEKAAREFEQFLSKRPDHPEREKIRKAIRDLLPERGAGSSYAFPAPRMIGSA